MVIGKIVKSDSHITYACQISGLGEAEEEPSPHDYAFGRFVRVPLRPGMPNERASTYVIGVIYNTLLLNPTFGVLGPRLSNEEQIQVFSPDYLSEKAIIVSILLLGTMEPLQSTQETSFLTLHGIPPFSLDLGSQVETMTEEEIRAFHFYADPGKAASLHMGYLPHLIAQPNHLLPLVVLNLIEQVERLFPVPDALSLLSIVKRNFAWKLKVETTG